MIARDSVDSPFNPPGTYDAGAAAEEAMVEAFIKYILGEFRVITDTPLSFFTSLVVAIVIIWIAMNWRYGGVIDNKDAEITTLKSENARLRVALSIDPATPSALLQLTNNELAAKAGTVVTRLRKISAINHDRAQEIRAQTDIDEKTKKDRIEAVQREL
jgi:hypothetical protein